MRKYGPSFALLIFAASITLACGSSPHMLQSLTVSPATADAQVFPGGKVQFSATGFFSSSPRTVTPLSATWGACQIINAQETPTTAVSVSNNGLAQCSAGAAGAYEVWAFSENPSNVTCLAIGPCGHGCGRIRATARLTCP